jgi:DNA helicase-2/ATP-dependent DNA helicase PcrA
MLQFEIRNNSIRQSLLSSKNEENRNADVIANADLIVSTIHGAKGLEFDNVVITYKNENNMAEDKKRMYYVAFTRAMNSELVLAYDTTVYPKIMTDYETILEALEKKDLNTGTAAGTVDADVNVAPDMDNAANATVAKAQMELYKQGYRRPRAVAKVKTKVDTDTASSDTEDADTTAEQTSAVNE